MRKIAIIGLGRFGMSLAERLTQEGLEVLGVDLSIDVVNSARDKITLAIQADATDVETLRSLGVGKVDSAVIAIGDNFEACQLAMLAARDLDYPTVIARANDRVKEKIMRRLGADEVIMPEEQAALKLAQRLAKPSLLEAVDLGNEHSFVQVEAPSGVCNKTLLELHLRKNYGVNLVALKRPIGDSVEFSIPGPDTSILARDVLLLVGRNKDIERFMREKE